MANDETDRCFNCSKRAVNRRELLMLAGATTGLVVLGGAVSGCGNQTGKDVARGHVCQFHRICIALCKALRQACGQFSGSHRARILQATILKLNIARFKRRLFPPAPGHQSK